MPVQTSGLHCADACSGTDQWPSALPMHKEMLHCAASLLPRRRRGTTQRSRSPSRTGAAGAVAAAGQLDVRDGGLIDALDELHAAGHGHDAAGRHRRTRRRPRAREGGGGAGRCGRGKRGAHL